MKSKKIFIYLGIGAILCATAFVSGGFADSSSSKLAATITKDKFTVTHPIVMDTAYTTDYVADIQAVQHVELKAKVDGYLEKIHVDEGQVVKKGQLLFSISNQQYEAELLKATAQLKSAIAEAKTAEVELKNVTELVEKNVISETQREMAQSKLDALKAKIEEAKSDEATAKLNLSYAEIKAPFDGIIDRIPNKVGSLVEEGTSLTTISDNQKVYAYFNVSEKEYLDIMISGKGTEDEKVSLILANNEPYLFEGKIETVESKVDKTTGNIAFRASFSNPNQLLKHGFTGKIRIKHQMKDALIIPQVATMESQDKMFVYVLDAENTVKRKSITPKLRLPHLYIIESGLTVSDKILYKGLQHVREGVKIETELTPFMQGESSGQLALNAK